MPLGRAFPIRRQDVKAYSALTPNGSRGRKLVARRISYRPNAGVTHIAAVNGPGAYRRAHEPSAREAAGLRRIASNPAGETLPMIRLSRRGATPNKKRKTKAKAKKRAAKRNPAPQAAATPNRKKRAGKRRARKARPNRAYSMEAVRKARKSLKRKSTRTRKKARAAASRRRVRRLKAATPNRRRRTRRATANRRRRTTRRVHANKRRRTSRRRLTANRRRRTSRRVHANKRRRSAGKRRSTRRVRRARRNTRAATPNRRRRSRRAHPNRRRHSRRMRANRRRGYRRNGTVRDLMSFFKNAAVTGLVIAGGFFAHKVLTNLLEENFMYGAFNKPAEAPAATNGFELKDHTKLLSGGVVMVAGVAATGYLVKNKELAAKIAGGMVASFLQQAIMSYLVASENATGVKYLSGLEDGAAARLSAMAGDVPRTTIQPFYTRLGGYGEYFQNPAMSGMGEYFQNPAMSGFGALEAAAGLGNSGIYSASAGYGSNGDIYQAVAGTHHRYIEGQHIDPTRSNLDRELSMMESQAGVGAVSIWNTELSPMQDGEGSAFRDGSLGRVYSASAGFGEFIEPGANGVQTVPSTSTWVPGEAEGELWAGVRNIDSNMATADVPAGIMQTIGGSGIFG